MGDSEKKYFKEIIIGVFITVLGGFILFLISQFFLIDNIYGILALIIFILSIAVIVLSYYLYIERKERKKKKPLLYGLAGRDRDEWLRER